MELIYRVLLLTSLATFSLLTVNGHGFACKPTARFIGNKNCGGKGVGRGQPTVRGENCGLCGDPKDDSVGIPRTTEYGGPQGRLGAVIVYREGDIISADSILGNPHQGFLQWRLCINALNESQDCFDDHLLRIVGVWTKYMTDVQFNASQATYQLNITRWDRPDNNNLWISVKLQLPPGVTADRAVIQFNYRSGRLAWCQGAMRATCGPQETFRSCSDIRIIPREILPPFEILQSVGFGGCLTLNNFTKNDQPISLTLTNCSTNNALQSVMPYQPWVNFTNANNSILFTNQFNATDFCLDVAWSFVGVNLKIQAFRCVVTSDVVDRATRRRQIWGMVVQDDGSFQIKNEGSHYCVRANTPTSLTQVVCSATDDYQRWRIVGLKSAPPLSFDQIPTTTAAPIPVESNSTENDYPRNTVFNLYPNFGSNETESDESNSNSNESGNEKNNESGIETSTPSESE